MATVRFKDATRHYPGNPKPTIDKLNIDIADGEFLVFVGRHVSVAVGPGRLQLRYVGWCDLRCWTVMLPERVAGGMGARHDARHDQEY